MLDDFVPLFIMIVLATALALTLLKLHQVLGPRRPNRTKARAYESGMDSIGTAHQRYSVRFYLVATSIRSAWRGEKRIASLPKRATSYFGPAKAIISIAQQASPIGIGISEFERAQFTTVSTVVVR